VAHAIHRSVVLSSLVSLACACPSAARMEGRTAPSIHQEVVFNATPHQVYRALTDPAEFAKVTGEPVTASSEAGASFSTFGGRVTGRNIELEPDHLLVQAWRSEAWPKGAYSMVRFELRPEGSGSTRLIFDHDGFPADARESLAEGWKTHYWEPMQKYLALLVSGS
jgi:uncharacterized protein YndB with AHSA1/START domain